MAWKDVQMIGFSPDLPNTTQGIVIASDRAMPTDRGIGNTLRMTEDSTALNGASMGGASVFKTDGTQRIFVGTATKLYELSAPTPTTPTDRSDTAYSASTTNTWAFAQFGDVTLAINKGNILRFIAGGAAFAAVGAAPVPKASCITVCGPVSAPVVMVADYDDGTNNYRDGWFASSLADYTGWVTGNTECVNGRLLDDVPGPITALIGFRDEVVAFKRTGMYLGTYIGAPTIWQWRRLSSDIGCVGKNAVVKANDILYWADEAGVWQFDGSYPQLIRGAVHSYWAKKTASNLASSAINANYYKVIWDKPKHVLHVLGGTTSPSIPFGMSWNSVSGMWLGHLSGTPFAWIVDNYATNAREIISARCIVTNNNKVGTLTWDVSATEPGPASIYMWCISDYVNTYVVKGLRLHVRVHSSSSTSTGLDPNANFTGTIYSVAAEKQWTPENINTLNSATLTWRDPDRLDGQMAAPILGLFVGGPAATAWEFSGVSVNIEPAGRS